MARLTAIFDMQDRITSNLRRLSTGLRRVETTSTNISNRLRTLNGINVNPTVRLRDLASPLLNRVEREIIEVRTRLNRLTSMNLSPTIRIRDLATRTLTRITSMTTNIFTRLRAIATMRVAPLLNARDRVTSTVSRIGRLLRALTPRVNIRINANATQANNEINDVGDRLGWLRNLAGSIFLGLGLREAFDSTIGAASRLEQNLISMEHFMGIGNLDKDAATIKEMTKSYIDMLKHNAQVTPFSEVEVMTTGRRAIQVADGDVKGAMEVLQIAQDMAALNPEKSLSDSIEAIADARMGEFERMKEFGMKYSQEDFKTSGWEGFLDVANKKFQGGAEKLSKSAAGIWGRITGTLEAGLQQMGIGALEKLKPQLEKIAKAFDDGALDKYIKLGSSALAGFVDGVVNAVSTIVKHWDTIRAVGEAIAIGFGIWFAASKIKGLILFVKAAGGLKLALLGLLSPFALIAVGIGLLYVAWKKNIFGLKDLLAPVIDFIKFAFDSALTVIKAFIDYIQGNSQGASDMLTKAFGPEMGEKIMNVFAKIQEVFQSVMDFIIHYGTIAWNFLLEIVAFVMPYIETIITVAWNKIQSVFTTVYNYIMEIMPMIFQIITFVWQAIVPIIGIAIQTIWSIVKSGFEYLWSIITTVLTAIWGFIQLAWTIISGIFQAALQLLTGDFEGAWKTMENMVSSAIGIIQGIISNWVSGALQIGKDFVNFIKDGFLAAWDGLVATAKSLWGSITSIFSKKQTVSIEQQVTTYQRTASSPASGRADGRHADGLSYVPWDGYKAILHKGERVLTAEENETFSGKQRSALIGSANTGKSRGSTIQTTKIEKLIGTIHVHNEADENRLISKIRRVLEKEISVGGDGLYD